MLLRPVHPSDAPRIQAFVRGLSPRSRLERFFAPIHELSAPQLERMTSNQGLNLAAIDRYGSIVGLAEYARVREHDAEFAIVVADEWQGQGLGEALLKAAFEHARRSGIDHVAGVTHAGNAAMRALARKLGCGVRRDEDPDLLRLERALSA
jgi:acetyltransferase